MKLLRKTATRHPARPRLEALEDRTLLSVSVIESFEAGSLASYSTALRFAPSARILPIAAHDGLQGLVKQDGYEWMIREDSGSTVHQGDTVSVWVKFADAADGRAYLGFDSHDIAPAHATLATGGTLSVVMAANTNQLIIQSDSGSNGVASFTNIATTAQTYQADHWYRLEATWGAGGAITGRLYDSNGTTLLSSVSGTTTTVPFPNGGGIGLRGFGHDKYFDTVVLDTGSTGTTADRANAGGGLDPGWVPGNPPPAAGNGPSGGPAPVPWAYTSTPGTGIEVQLASFNQLQQVAIVNGVVGLAAANNSLITGTSQVGWGDPLETPLLAQYIFRQRPGESTRLVGASSTKHFFSSAHADSQHLNPGENDTYGSGLNAAQSLYTYGSEIDPVTGTLHSPIDRGTLSVDGIVNNGSRTFSSPIDLLLQVNVADLDPAQNPTGTRWFLMGNLFVGGEQDVSQASRWVEITPIRNALTGNFTFNYPNGSGGQLNFRTIPGLAPALSSIPDQTILSSQQTLNVPLTVFNPDGHALTFSATGQSLAYVLTQQTGTLTYYSVWDNWGGRGEKWLLNPSNQWYYVLPSGELDRWDGSSITNGPALGNVGASFYADPTLLASPPANQPHATFSFSGVTTTGATLTITRDTAWTSGMAVTVTVTDGVNSQTDTKSFNVTVATPPVLSPVADRTIPSSQQTLNVPLTVTNPSGHALTFSVTGQSLAYIDSTVAGTPTHYAYRSVWDNWGGRGEKWVQAANGQWYFILANGQFYQWDGSSRATGTLLANVGASYYADPTRLTDPPANQPHATFSFSGVTTTGATLTITRDTAWISGLAVIVTVTDGVNSQTDNKVFDVFVTP